MKSDSEEGEVGAGSLDFTVDQDDHLQIKPPQRYPERSVHPKDRTHDRRSDKRSSKKEGRHHSSSSKSHHYRERESHDRRRDEKHDRSSKISHREPRREDQNKAEHENRGVIRDAREKITKSREERQATYGHETGEEELHRRRDRLLAALSGTKRPHKEEPKQRSATKELPASYKQDHLDDDGDETVDEETDAGKRTPKSSPKKRAREEESTTNDSAASSASEEGSSDETADESRSSERIQNEGKSNSDSEHDEKMEVEDVKKEKPDIREEDEFLENKSSSATKGDRDEDSQDAHDTPNDQDDTELVDYVPGIQGCRRVEEFHCLNRIEEGTYGVVYRALDKQKNEIVALKRLKMEKEKDGFPITSLREISTLLKAPHQNIVTVREIVVGSNMDKIYIVMDYVEHDLKSLMKTMKSPFLVGEVKTLMSQLLKAVAHLHDNWILHRDLKTSNLLLSHKGILKVGDFGLAREYGSPLKPYTPIVVTLWYRAPELLLGAKQYSCPIDVWSVGCIFAELLTLQPLFPGKADIDQLNKIFKMLGTPSEKIWPGYGELPIVKQCSFDRQPYNVLRKTITETMLSSAGFSLLNKLLTYCPSKRITAEEAVKNEWFAEKPEPIHPEMFPTWPAKSEGSANVRRAHSPKPPSGGQQYSKTLDDEYGFHMTSSNKGASYKGTGFSLKF